MNTTQIKIGDTVKANYGYDLIVTGKVAGFDGYGGTEIEFASPVEIMGSMRDGVFISKNWRDLIKLVEAA